MAEEKKTIHSMLDERRVFNPPKGFVEKAHVKSMDEYKKLYGESEKDLEGFWAEQGRNASNGSRNGTRCSTSARPPS